jgi:uncharacterized protein YggE
MWKVAAGCRHDSRQDGGATTVKQIFIPSNLQEILLEAFSLRKFQKERTIRMKSNVYKIGLLAVFLILFAAAVYYYLPRPNTYTRVTVAGESQTQAPPDNAVVSFSVVTQNALAVNAQQENARKITAVIQAVKDAAGDPQLEIETSNYKLDPEQDYSAERMPKIIGYEARNTLSVTTPKMDQVGALIDAAIKAGANSVEGIAFVLREDSPTRGDSLGIATRQAMAKAEAIARSLGGRVVRIVETYEGGVVPDEKPSSPSAFSMANTNAASVYRTPVQAGSINMYSKVVLAAEIEIKR